VFVERSKPGIPQGMERLLCGLSLSMLLLGCPARKPESPPAPPQPVETMPVKVEPPPVVDAGAAVITLGMPCLDGKCAEGLTCMRYYGVAGPRGPEFSSCERPCEGSKCPAGESCTTISDGPGRVCRPSNVE
jgi:hypothetical protein